MELDPYEVVACRGPDTIYKIGRMPTIRPGRIIQSTRRQCEIRGGTQLVYDRSSVEASIAFWKPVAETGDTQAQTYLAELYERGIGGTPDYDEALAWYERAAEQGFKPALFNLGRLYSEGLGVAENEQTAARYYREAMGIDPSLADVVSFVDSEELAFLRASVEERNQIIARQEEMIDQLEATISQLERERDAALENVAGLETNLASARSQLAQGLGGQAHAVRALQMQINALEGDRAQLRHEQETLLASQAELENARARLAAELEARQAGDTETVRRLSADLAAARAEIGQLAAQRDAAVNAERIALEQLSVSGQRLDEDLADLAERESRIAEVETEQSRSREWIERERAQVAEVRRDVEQAGEAYRAQLAALDARQAELERLDERLEAERLAQAARASELDRLVAREASLAAELSRLRQREADIAQRERALEAASANYQGETGELSRLRMDLDASNSRVEAYRNQVEQQEARINDLEAALETKSDEATRAQIEVNALQTVLEIHVRNMRGSAEVEPEEEVSIDPMLQELDFGNFHALLIGNEHYPYWGVGDVSADLETPHEDVEVLERILIEHYGFKTQVLKDAGRREMQDTIEDITKAMGPNDNLVIYFAGHGVEINANNTRADETYWIPSDAVYGRDSTYVRIDSVKAYLARSNARKILLVADACFSGGITAGGIPVVNAAAPSADQLEVWERASKSQSRVALSSGGMVEVLDEIGGEHSPFAQSVIANLANNRRVLLAAELHAKVEAEVYNLTSRLGLEHPQRPEFAQLPDANHSAGDFIFRPLAP